IVHPREQWESNRRVRVSPFYEREKALGAVFFETAGWERPNWYASNRPLLEEYGERVMPRRYEWDARWWSPIINAEHLGMRDRKWFSDHLPDDGAVQITDLTSSWATIGVWGPRARDLLQSITDADVSNEGFPFGTCRLIDIGPVRALASRISYVGELGWEIYLPFEQGARLWDDIWQAGQPFRIA